MKHPNKSFRAVHGLFVVLAATISGCASIPQQSLVVLDDPRQWLGAAQFNDRLLNHIEQRRQKSYVIYTFYPPYRAKDYHRQYWQGLLVLDDIRVSENLVTQNDDLGNKIVDWHKLPFSDSISRDFLNPKGFHFRRESINPDDSMINAIDLDNDGIIDYAEYYRRNGEAMTVVSERLGEHFYDRLLAGLNPYCDFAHTLGMEVEQMPGCGDRSSSDAGSRSSLGTGAAGAGNPYDAFVDQLCEGVDTGNGIPAGGVHSQDGYTEIRSRTYRIGDTNIHEIQLTSEDQDGNRTTSRYRVDMVDDGTMRAFDVVTVTRPDGSSTSQRKVVTNEPDGTVVVHNSTEEQNPDGSTKTTSSTVTRHPDGTNEASVPTTEVCNSGGGCTTTEHPGDEPSFGAAMAEFCSIVDSNDRPSDLEELNRRASEERCSIEPDESNSDEDSDENALTENCIFDDDGVVEIGEMLTGGGCVTAAGGARFDYVNPQQCNSNYIDITARGRLMIGGTGLVGFICDPLVCRRPEN